MMSSPSNKLTFEQAYPEAVAKVANFIQKQKDLASVEFAFMLNMAVVNKVKQGEFIKPPKRIVSPLNLETEAEELKFKEEISTGASETDQEDRASASSEFSEREVRVLDNSKVFTHLMDAITEFHDELRSLRFQCETSVEGEVVTRFVRSARAFIDLVLLHSSKNSRIHTNTAVAAVILQAGAHAKLPKSAITGFLSRYLNTANLNQKLSAVKQSSLFRTLASHARLHKHNVQSDAAATGHALAL